MEFMSQGVPVVASRTKIDSFYFDEGEVHFFPSGDHQAMAAAMLDVINNRDLRDSLVAKGYEYVEVNGWARKKQEYLDLIDSLATETFATLQPTPAASPASNAKKESSTDAQALSSSLNRSSVENAEINRKTTSSAS